MSKGKWDGTAVAEVRGDQNATACRFVENLICATLRIGIHELRAESRGRAAAAFARQMAMYLAHVHFGISLTGVGRYFGRDRTTVAHACAVIEDARDAAPAGPLLDSLETALASWQSGMAVLERP